MALSPNYSWAEPDNSSLVKNGASDIRTLGDAIDTSVWNVGFGQAGKNKIINGDFSINQRGFSSSTASGVFTFDRFNTSFTGGTVTYSAQTFTLGSAPVAGYEAKNYLNIDTTGQSAAGDFTRLQQKIEGVRTFAGQTLTISFWAKAASGTPSLAVELQQVFGTGGSPSSVVTTGTTKQATTTSWARYSFVFSLPSISGKTIGTANDDSLNINIYTSAGSTFNSRTDTLGIQNNTFSFWGLQIEYGSKATPFQTATGTIQGELAACQRYYWNWKSGTSLTMGIGRYTTNTEMGIYTMFPVTMRTAPTLVATTGTNYYQIGADGFNSFTIFQQDTSSAWLYNGSEISGTSGNTDRVYTNNAAASVSFSAEL